MTVMDSPSALGAKRRYSAGYGEHWPQRHGCEGALSWFDISGLEDQRQGLASCAAYRNVNGHRKSLFP